MVVALNILLPIVIIGILYAGYKMKKMLLSIVLCVIVSVLYGFIQPSYMPKGVVKPMPPVELKVIDKPIQDRMLKPKSTDERDEKMKAEVKASDERLEAFIQQMKKEKE